MNSMDDCRGVVTPSICTGQTCINLF